MTLLTVRISASVTLIMCCWFGLLIDLSYFKGEKLALSTIDMSKFSVLIFFLLLQFSHQEELVTVQGDNFKKINQTNLIFRNWMFVARLVYGYKIYVRNFGVLINDTVILTVAQNFYPTKFASNVQIALDIHKRRTEPEYLIPTQGRKIHPGFSLGGEYGVSNDIALLQLSKSVNDLKKKKIITVTDYNPPLGSECLGLVEVLTTTSKMRLYEQPQSLIKCPMNDSEVSTDTTVTCSRYLRKLYTNIGRGAPLMCDKKLYGLASYGPLSLGVYDYVVWTRVGAFKDWINKTLQDGIPQYNNSHLAKDSLEEENNEISSSHKTCTLLNVFLFVIIVEKIYKAFYYFFQFQ